MNAEDILATLRALRRRLVAQALAVRSARALFIAAGLLVALALMDRWVAPSLWSAALVGIVVMLALLWAAISVGRRVPSLAAAATVIDTAAATRNRFATALEFSTQPEAEPRRRALVECAEYVRGRDFAPSLPWRWPRELRWLWVPLAALALLRWDAHSVAARQRADAELASQKTAPTARNLQKLAQELKKNGDAEGSAEMKRLAAEIEKAAERLRSGAKNGGEAEKSTLRELSALEDLVRQMQEQKRAQLTPEELAELSKALRENPVTDPAGQQLEKGELAASAEALEKKAQELKQKGDERTAEQIEKALKAALERLAQQKELSSSARQMSQQGAAPGEAMQRLATMLRNMPSPRGASAGQPGAPMSPQALQKLLSTIEDLKQGGGATGQPGAQKGSENQMEMQAFDHRAADDPSNQKNSTPTGLPGGERDEGTTASPLAEQPNPSQPKGADLALRGMAGAGETASQLLPGATSDDSRARRKYKELYDTMAPAAEEAVQQENIPLGSRYFVKRYFEAIRPKD